MRLDLTLKKNTGPNPLRTIRTRPNKICLNLFSFSINDVIEMFLHYFNFCQWSLWKEKYDPRGILYPEPDPIFYRIRIRNPSIITIWNNSPLSFVPFCLYQCLKPNDYFIQFLLYSSFIAFRWHFSTITGIYVGLTGIEIVGNI